MRVLLINPFYPISETPSPPLGLAYLAAVLKKEGVEIKIADFVVTPFDEKNLENPKPWRNASPTAPLVERLKKRYGNQKGKGEKELKETLEFAYNARYIQKQTRDNVHFWKWAD